MDKQGLVSQEKASFLWNRMRIQVYEYSAKQNEQSMKIEKHFT